MGIGESAAIVGSTKPQSDCEGKGKLEGLSQTNSETGKKAQTAKERNVFHSRNNSEIFWTYVRRIMPEGECDCKPKIIHSVILACDNSEVRIKNVG